MFKKFAAVILLVVCSCGVFGADFTVPAVTIEGVGKCPLGELVCLKPSQFEKTADLLKVSYQWVLTENGKEVTDKKVLTEGNAIIFGSGVRNRTIQVQLLCGFLFQSADKSQVDVRVKLLSADLVIGDEQPPTPPVPPTPDIKSELGKQVYGWAQKVQLSQGDKVKSAAALVKSFREQATKCEEGEYTKLEDALKASATANQEALRTAGISPTPWMEFFKELQTCLYSQYQAKKLVAPKDLSILFDQVTQGLMAVK